MLADGTGGEARVHARTVARPHNMLGTSFCGSAHLLSLRPRTQAAGLPQLEDGETLSSDAVSHSEPTTLLYCPLVCGQARVCVIGTALIQSRA